MSSAASLLLEMLNILRLEMFRKPLEILIIPVDCKLFPTKYNSCNVVL